MPIYQAAARRYHLPWEVLAAINWVETDYGHDLTVSSAGAVGWMQFLPSTWRMYSVGTDGKGSADPYDPRAAIFAAARLLDANGGARHLRRAIFADNHADWYVDEVVFVAARIVGVETQPSGGARSRLSAMESAAELLNGSPYIYGGGHAGWEPAAGYGCSGFVSAVLHAAGYLEQPVTTQTLPGQSGIEAGPGKWVTILDRTDAATTSEDHVIINLDGQWWESGGSSSDSGAATVHPVASISSAYLATFNLILHPQGL
ncbi:MAG TPA: lytic transglycosylase domain-containing protein [Solirubrobacteraceae bacterium]|nr:lytic transglycosylase domain-containing protein [Solirubrobacteraceae bacterium]